MDLEAEYEAFKKQQNENDPFTQKIKGALEGIGITDEATINRYLTSHIDIFWEGEISSEEFERRMIALICYFALKDARRA